MSKQKEIIINIDYNDLKNMFDYLQDKVENCYQNETQKTIDDFLRDYQNSTK